MNFIENIVGDLVLELLYSFFKIIGVLFKWMFYLGRKSFEKIQKEKWNRLVGFIVFGVLVFIVLVLI